MYLKHTTECESGATGGRRTHPASLSRAPTHPWRREAATAVWQSLGHQRPDGLVRSSSRGGGSVSLASRWRLLRATTGFTSCHTRRPRGRVVPLRQVAVTGGPVGRRSELHPVHTAATLQSVVCVTDGVLPPEKLLQLGHVEQTLHILVIVHTRAERLLVRLTLKCLLLDGARRQKSVDEAGFLLSVSPDAGHGLVIVVVGHRCRRQLVIVGRVAVGVEHHQPIGADQVQAAAARLAAQHEDELRRRDVVKPVHDLVRCHHSINFIFDRHRYPLVPVTARGTCQVRGCRRHPTLGNSMMSGPIAFKFGVCLETS